MTLREFYKAIIETVENEDIVEKAKDLLETLDHQNNSRKTKRSAETEANAAELFDIVKDLPQPFYVADLPKDLPRSNQFYSSMLTVLVKQGKVEKVGKVHPSAPYQYRVIEE